MDPDPFFIAAFSTGVVEGASILLLHHKNNRHSDEIPAATSPHTNSEPQLLQPSLNTSSTWPIISSGNVIFPSLVYGAISLPLTLVGGASPGPVAISSLSSLMVSNYSSSSSSPLRSAIHPSTLSSLSMVQSSMSTIENKNNGNTITNTGSDNDTSPNQADKKDNDAAGSATTPTVSETNDDKRIPPLLSLRNRVVKARVIPSPPSEVMGSNSSSDNDDDTVTPPPINENMNSNSSSNRAMLSRNLRNENKKNLEVMRKRKQEAKQTNTSSSSSDHIRNDGFADTHNYEHTNDNTRMERSILSKEQLPAPASRIHHGNTNPPSISSSNASNNLSKYIATLDGKPLSTPLAESMRKLRSALVALGITVTIINHVVKDMERVKREQEAEETLKLQGRSVSAVADMLQGNPGSDGDDVVLRLVGGNKRNECNAWMEHHQHAIHKFSSAYSSGRLSSWQSRNHIVTSNDQERNVTVLPIQCAGLDSNVTSPMISLHQRQQHFPTYWSMGKSIAEWSDTPLTKDWFFHPIISSNYMLLPSQKEEVDFDTKSKNTQQQREENQKTKSTTTSPIPILLCEADVTPSLNSILKQRYSHVLQNSRSDSYHDNIGSIPPNTTMQDVDITIAALSIAAKHQKILLTKANDSDDWNRTQQQEADGMMQSNLVRVLIGTGNDFLSRQITYSNAAAAAASSTTTTTLSNKNPAATSITNASNSNDILIDSMSLIERAIVEMVTSIRSSQPEEETVEKGQRLVLSDCAHSSSSKEDDEEEINSSQPPSTAIMADQDINEKQQQQCKISSVSSSSPPTTTEKDTEEISTTTSSSSSSSAAIDTIPDNNTDNNNNANSALSCITTKSTTPYDSILTPIEFIGKTIRRSFEQAALTTSKTIEQAALTTSKTIQNANIKLHDIATSETIQNIHAKLHSIPNAIQLLLSSIANTKNTNNDDSISSKVLHVISDQMEIATWIQQIMIPGWKIIQYCHNDNNNNNSRSSIPRNGALVLVCCQDDASTAMAAWNIIDSMNTPSRQPHLLDDNGGDTMNVDTEQNTQICAIFQNPSCMNTLYQMLGTTLQQNQPHETKVSDHESARMNEEYQTSADVESSIGNIPFHALCVTHLHNHVFHVTRQLLKNGYSPMETQVLMDELIKMDTNTNHDNDDDGNQVGDVAL